MSLEFNNKSFIFGVKNSLLNKAWIKKKTNDRLTHYISQKYSYSQLMSSLLSSRNKNIEKLDSFLKPKLKIFFPDPLIFNDMEKSVERIILALKKKEKISVFGDYDVDGLSSIALIKKYFDFLNIPIFSYIPDRIKEGYGPNKKAIDKIKLKNISVLIMVDCGTTSIEAVSYANKLGIDIIIIDHHKAETQLPNAFAIINPNTLKDTSSFNYLCATGLTYIFIVCLNKYIKNNNLYIKNNFPDLLNFLDIVALATVCDVVPLIQLNRAFVRQGLKIMSKRLNLGLKVLADDTNLNKKPDEEDLGFFYGPRLNAGGRLGKADLGEKLLSTKDTFEAELLVKQLNTFNYQRKLIEEKVLNEATNKINNKILNNYSLILNGDNWHEGVLGIVASRIKEKYNKPVFLLTKNKNNILKGSGRSIANVDIGSAIIHAKEKNIVINGGGHQMAAGITLSYNKLNEFKIFFNEYVKKKTIEKSLYNYLHIDSILSVGGINNDLFKMLDDIGPFGSENPKPIFAAKNIKIINPKIVGESENHISCHISDKSGKTIKGIAFHSANNSLGKVMLSDYKKRLFNLVGHLKKTEWKNKDYFELIIEDGVISKDII